MLWSMLQTYPACRNIISLIATKELLHSNDANGATSIAWNIVNFSRTFSSILSIFFYSMLARLLYKMI